MTDKPKPSPQQPPAQPNRPIRPDPRLGNPLYKDVGPGTAPKAPPKTGQR